MSLYIIFIYIVNIALRVKILSMLRIGISDIKNPDKYTIFKKINIFLYLVVCCRESHFLHKFARNLRHVLLI